jgi:predicted enzyme related to lactoylglutathione lyase
MSDPVFFWEINARDGDALAGFYADVFGWKTERDNTGFHTVHSRDEQERGIAGGIFTGKGQLPPHRALYVMVDSVQTTLDAAREAGAEILLEPFAGPGGQQLAFFADPEGHITGLVERA